MQTKITGRHVDVTPAIQEYAEKKTAKLLRYFDRISEINVVIDRIDHSYQVEVIADVEHGGPIIAKRLGDDLYAVIDAAHDVMERQLTDHKEKRRNRKHPPSLGASAGSVS